MAFTREERESVNKRLRRLNRDSRDIILFWIVGALGATDREDIVTRALVYVEGLNGHG